MKQNVSVYESTWQNKLRTFSFNVMVQPSFVGGKKGVYKSASEMAVQLGRQFNLGSLELLL